MRFWFDQIAARLAPVAATWMVGFGVTEANAAAIVGGVLAAGYTAFELATRRKGA